MLLTLSMSVQLAAGALSFGRFAMDGAREVGEYSKPVFPCGTPKEFFEHSNGSLIRQRPRSPGRANKEVEKRERSSGKMPEYVTRACRSVVAL